MDTHYVHPALLEHRIRVLVVGAGGNGGLVLDHLTRLHQALLAWGHPGGLHVTLMDGDTVSETNCVRQSFSVSDIGHPKTTVLINRYNVFKGLDWTALPTMLGPHSSLYSSSAYDIVIGCVDTKSARRALATLLTNRNCCRVDYYIDLGNSESTGQFILGEPRNLRNQDHAERLPCVFELFPEIIKGTEDPGPSCSAAEALDRQGPMINSCVVAPAIALLTTLLRKGAITHQGGFVAADRGVCEPVMIDFSAKKPLRRKA